eukprot:5019641-Pyramimonas_sp.AAC.1
MDGLQGDQKAQPLAPAPAFPSAGGGVPSAAQASPAVAVLAGGASASAGPAIGASGGTLSRPDAAPGAGPSGGSPSEPLTDSQKLGRILATTSSLATKAE